MGSELEWLGFDDQGTLMMYESTGKLHGLYSVYGWKWVTLCDTSKLDSVKKSNGHHWVIGVSGGQLLTALCVNKTTFPSAFPKPVRGVHGVSLEYTLEHHPRRRTQIQDVETDPDYVVCSSCNPGTYSDTEDAMVCVECTEGFVQENYFQTQCEACPVNHAALSKGMTACEECPWVRVSFFPFCIVFFFFTNNNGITGKINE